jgi:hypothetical protein
VLYAGLMITAEGPKLIEYNARFGDPECQVLMMRLKDDLLTILSAAVHGELEPVDVRWRDEAALTVVVAAQGYPGDYDRGSEIRGLANAASTTGIEIFHAGTARDGRSHRRLGRPRPQRHGIRANHCCSPGARLCGRRPNRLGQRLLPPRHRPPRGRAGACEPAGATRLTSSIKFERNLSLSAVSLVVTFLCP